MANLRPEIQISDQFHGVFEYIEMYVPLISTGLNGVELLLADGAVTLSGAELAADNCWGGSVGSVGKAFGDALRAPGLGMIPR